MIVYPALATLLALFVYIWVFMNVGRARKRYGIDAPSITGNANFERYYRVQVNMLEQFVLFLPSLWLFAFFVSYVFAALLGVGWCVGRVMYAIGYYEDAKKRGPGFGVSIGCNSILLLGALIGTLMALPGVLGHF